MRYTSLVALSLLLSVCSFAQPIIVESSGPVAGSSWTEYQTDAAEGLTLGPAGAAQVWNYTNFTEEFETSSLDFLDPSLLPSEYDGLFPDAGIAQYFEEDSSAQFFISEPDGFYVDGFASMAADAEPPGNILDFDPNNLLLPYDFSYLDIRSHTSTTTIEFNPGVPVRLRSTTISEFSGDGYGSLEIPAGIFGDVLRIRNFSYRIDSTYADTNGDDVFEFIESTGPSDTSIVYYHVQNAAPVLLASLDMNEDETEAISFAYFTVAGLGLGEEASDDYLSLYPNPASEYVWLRHSSTKSVQYEIMDISGKVVLNGRTTTMTSAVPIHELNNGLYMLRISDGTSEGRRTKKFFVHR